MVGRGLQPARPQTLSVGGCEASLISRIDGDRRLPAREQCSQVLEVFASLIAHVFEVTQMRGREEALRLQAVHAENHERQRLAMELHDGLVQDVIAARMVLELPSAPTERSKIKGLLDDAVRRCRAVMVRLDPDVVTTTDVLRVLHDETSAVNPEARSEARLPPQLEQRCPETVEALVRIAHELLANVRRHAGGALEELSVVTVGNALVLTVVDRGPGGTPSHSPRATSGFARCTTGRRL